jgi:hypothetical protein
MSIYMPLMAKMAENNSFIMGFHWVNFEIICDVKLIILLFYCYLCWKFM